MVGFSNGGMMMYRFLCTHADMLAGGASVAGTSVAHCMPSASIPLIHVAGTADAVVPYGGGYSQSLLAFGAGQVPRVVDSIHDLVVNDGCAPTPVTTNEGIVRVDRWDGCGDGAAHELVTLQGVAHGWPTGDPFDTTTEILHFLGLDVTAPPPTTTTTTTTEDPTTTTSTTTEDPTTTTTAEEPTTTTTIE